jgi:hypothetical protein
MCRVAASPLFGATAIAASFDDRFIVSRPAAIALHRTSWNLVLASGLDARANISAILRAWKSKTRSTQDARSCDGPPQAAEPARTQPVASGVGHRPAALPPPQLRQRNKRPNWRLRKGDA